MKTLTKIKIITPRKLTEVQKLRKIDKNKISKILETEKKRY